MGPRHRLTGKLALLDLLEAYDAVFCGVNGEVAADEGAGAGDFSTAGLANEDFAGVNFLATKALYAEASAGVVVDVLA